MYGTSRREISCYWWAPTSTGRPNQPINSRAACGGLPSLFQFTHWLRCACGFCACFGVLPVGTGAMEGDGGGGGFGGTNAGFVGTRVCTVIRRGCTFRIHGGKRVSSLPWNEVASCLFLSKELHTTMFGGIGSLTACDCCTRCDAQLSV